MDSDIAATLVIISTILIVLSFIPLYLTLETKHEYLENLSKLIDSIDERYFYIRCMHIWNSYSDIVVILNISVTARPIGSRSVFFTIGYNINKPTKLNVTIVMADPIDTTEVGLLIPNLHSLPSKYFVSNQSMSINKLSRITLDILDDDFLWEYRTVTKISNVFHVSNW